MLFLLVDLSTVDLCDVVKFLCIDIFLFARSSFHLSGCLATTCRLVLSSVSLSVSWSVCQLVCLSVVCFSVGLSVQPSGWLSVCQLVLSSVSLSVSWSSVCLSVCLCVCLPRAYLALLFPAHQTISLSIFFVLFVSLIAYVSTNVTVCLFVCLLIYLLLALT